MTSDKEIRLRVKVIKDTDQLKLLQKELKRLNKQAAPIDPKLYDHIAQAQAKIAQSTRKLNKMFRDPPFKGWALSMMFAAMAVNRFLMSIYNTAKKTFTEIMASAEGTTTAFTILSGSLKYLEFAIGAAVNSLLGGLLPVLIPIIDMLAQWILDNKTLAGTLLLIGIILSFVVMFLAGLELALAAIPTAIAAWGAVTGAIGSLITLLGLGGLAGLLAWILVLVLIVYAMWVSNFGGMKDFLVNTFDIIWKTIKQIFTDIWNIIKTVIDIVVAIFKGDWKEVAILTWKLARQLVKLFLDALLAIGALVINILSFAWNLIKDIIFKIVIGMMIEIQKLWLGLIKWLLEKMMALSEKLGLGTGIFKAAIKGIDLLNKGLETAESLSKKVSSALTTGYITGAKLQEGFDKVSRDLGLTAKETITQPVEQTILQEYEKLPPSAKARKESTTAPSTAIGTNIASQTNNFNIDMKSGFDPKKMEDAIKKVMSSSATIKA